MCLPLAGLGFEEFTTDSYHAGTANQLQRPIRFSNAELSQMMIDVFVH
jgi:hypothetical protein